MAEVCAMCKYRLSKGICGNPKSPYYNQKIGLDGLANSCDYFLKNPAQDNFTKGVKASLDGNMNKAIKEYEMALTLGLPSDDEMQVRYFLGEAYFDLCRGINDLEIEQIVAKPEFSKAIEEMEKSVLMDSQAGYGYFSRAVNRVRLSALDTCYTSRARSIRKKEGINASISYLQQKLKLFDYLSTNPMLSMLLELGVLLYNERGEIEHARECFKKILEADVVDPVDETGYETKLRQKAEYSLQVLSEAQR